MKHITLDCREIATKSQLHDALTKAFCLPDWYGRNLDALHDCLSALPEDTYIMLLNLDAMEKHLGSYAEAFRRVLQETGNPHIRFLYGA